MVWWFNERVSCHHRRIFCSKRAREHSHKRKIVHILRYMKLVGQGVSITHISTAVVVTTHRRKKCSTMPQNTHSHSHTHAYSREHTNNTLTRWNNESQSVCVCVLCLLSVAYTVWWCLCTFIYMQAYTHCSHIHVRKVAYSYGYIHLCVYMLLDSNVCVPVNFQFVHSIAFFSLLFLSVWALFFLSISSSSLFFFSTRFTVHFFEKVFFPLLFQMIEWKSFFFHSKHWQNEIYLRIRAFLVDWKHFEMRKICVCFQFDLLNMNID